MLYNAVGFLPPETLMQILAQACRGNEFCFRLILRGFLSTLQMTCGSAGSQKPSLSKDWIRECVLIMLNGEMCLDEALNNFVSLVFFKHQVWQKLFLKGRRGQKLLVVVYLWFAAEEISLSLRACNGVCALLFDIYTIVFLSFSSRVVPREKDSVLPQRHLFLCQCEPSTELSVLKVKGLHQQP